MRSPDNCRLPTHVKSVISASATQPHQLRDSGGRSLRRLQRIESRFCQRILFPLIVHKVLLLRCKSQLINKRTELNQASRTPEFNYTGNEDCLFLSVYAPQNQTNLPVLIWIHGGGYGEGQGNNDLGSIINTNNNSFIGVAIQYRVSLIAASQSSSF